MKKGILIFYLFFIFVNLFAQNIVINPSFENKISCPTIGGSQMQYSTNWHGYRRSPDYFNSCLTDPTGFSVPTNAFGYQPAATGNSYAGIFAYVGGSNAGDTVYREYIGGQLSNPLIIGQKYYVSLKINTPNNTNVNCHSNNMGVLFSKIAYVDTVTSSIEDNITNRAPIVNFAHVYNSTIITDSVNWITISGSLIADSSYQYIIIGNFFDNQQTSHIKVNTAPYCNSYYLIDDICVSTDSMTCNGITGINEYDNKSLSIKVYPNPAQQSFIIELPNQQNFNLFVYDVTGRKVFQRTNATGIVSIDCSGFNSGIYFVQAVNEKNSLSSKLTKQQ